MKKHIIGIAGTIFILGVLLGGCTSSVNTEDTSEITSQAKAKTEKWFEANMIEAKGISVELCEYDKKKEFYDVVTGIYYKTDKKYCYWFNVDTEEFCSEEYYDTLVQYIRERLSADMKIEYEEMDIPVEAATIHGREGYSTRCTWAYHKFATDELETIADHEMASGEKEIKIVVAAPDKIINDIETLVILKEHPNWTFVLVENREALEYRVYYSDGEYHISRAFIDDRGILRYEISTIESLEIK